MAMYDTTQLRNASGKMYTKALFYELNLGGSEVLFTLKHQDHKGYVSLRKLFISLTVHDPSEVTFAETVFGDMSYWTAIQNSPSLSEYIEEWRQVADIKRKSEAFKAIIDEVQNEGRNRYSAAKFLIDEPWKPKDRASKEKQKKTTQAARTQVNDDVERLREYLN